MDSQDKVKKLYPWAKVIYNDPNGNNIHGWVNQLLDIKIEFLVHPDDDGGYLVLIGDDYEKFEKKIGLDWYKTMI